MENIQQILKNEKYNDNQIYLYKEDEYWYAYERSAFYMFSICCVDGLFKVKDSRIENVMLIAVLLKRIHSMANPHLTILEESENRMVIKCSTTCKGFLHWKDRFLPLISPLKEMNEYNEHTNYSYEN